MKIAINDKHLKVALLCIAAILFAIFLDLLPGELPVSINIVAIFSIFAGLIGLTTTIVFWVIKLFDHQ